MAEEPRELTEYHNDHDLLIRLNTLVEVLVQDVKKMEKVYVTQEQFWPVRALVYGCVAIMLTGLITGFMYLALHK